MNFDANYRPWSDTIFFGVPYSLYTSQINTFAMSSAIHIVFASIKCAHFSNLLHTTRIVLDPFSIISNGPMKSVVMYCYRPIETSSGFNGPYSFGFCPLIQVAPIDVLVDKFGHLGPVVVLCTMHGVQHSGSVPVILVTMWFVLSTV